GMEGDTALATDAADLRDRLDGTDLVVRVHDRHEAGAVVDGPCDITRVDATVAVHADHGHPDVGGPLEGVGRVEHRVMLDRAHDQAVLSIALPGLPPPAQRAAVGLGAAARP